MIIENKIEKWTRFVLPKQLLTKRYAVCLVGLYTTIVFWGIHSLVLKRPQTDFRVQILIITLLTPLLGYSIEWILKKLNLAEADKNGYFSSRFTWGIFIILGHTFTIGRVTFLSYMTMDDVGNVGVTGLNFASFFRSLIEPLNVHFVPLYKLVNSTTYAIWGWDNFGISLVSLFTTSSFYYLVYAILRIWLKKASPAIPFLVSFLASIWPVYWYNYAWKAGGLWMYLGGLFMCFFILSWVKFYYSTQKRDIVAIGLFSLATSMTCTYFPLPLALLGPVLLSIPFSLWKTRIRRLAPAISTSIIASLIYLFFQQFIIRYYHYQNAFFALESLKNIWWMFTSYLLYILSEIRTENLWMHKLALIIASFIFCSRMWYIKKQGDSTFHERMGLFWFSIGILVYTSILVCGGRLCHAHTVVIDRYGIFPVVAVLLFLTSILPWFKIKQKHSKLVATLIATVCIISAQLSIVNVTKKANFPEVIEVVTLRNTFFQDLEGALCGAYQTNYGRAGSFGEERPFVYLPDISLHKIRKIDRMIFAPAFIREQTGFSLEYYAKGIVSPCYDSFFVKFVPKVLLSKKQLAATWSIPAIQAFYLKHQLDYDGPINSNDRL
jgi:hypothetical protein